MNRPLRAFTSVSLAVCLAFTSLAGVALAVEEPTIVYTHISEGDFQKDLASKRVKSVIVNKRLRTLRVTLADGTHVLAHYPKHQEPQTVAKLKGEGITVTVLGKSEAEKEAKAKKPAHHKIRYIAGGVVIVVIVVVGAVLLVNRRRRRD